MLDRVHLSASNQAKRGGFNKNAYICQSLHGLFAAANRIVGQKSVQFIE